MNACPPTLAAAWAQRIAASGPRPALLERGAAGWQARTWEQIAADVARLARLIEVEGIRAGERVATLSPNRYEWLLVDLATLAVGGVHVPIHASLAGPQVAYQLRDSGARLLFVSADDQAGKLVDEWSRLDDRPPIIAFERLTAPLDPAPRTLAEAWAALPDHGAAAYLAEAALRVRPRDLATILYTSGTTGEPKGVMLCHENLASNAWGSLAMCGIEPEDLRLQWLPLSHIFARTCDLYTWILGGTRLALVAGPDALLPACQELRPTLLNGVPYFFEKVMRGLIERGQADLPGVLSAAFGGRMRGCVSGGAPLPRHVAEFYEARGLPLLEGYGMTEASPVITFSRSDAYKLGSVGRALDGVEVRIAPDGEILTRGPHVMLGYWNRPEDTARTIVDGWLHTGDLGQLDADGFLWITGRKKELIVTSGGKNVAPVALEALLMGDPLIRRAIVVGDGRPYLAALIVPEEAALREALGGLGVPQEPYAAALEDPRVVALFEQRIAARLSGVAQFEQVRRCRLLARDLSTEAGELTLTLKLRRQQILQNFAAQIDALYAARHL